MCKLLYRIKVPLYNFLIKVLVYKGYLNKTIKFVCVAMRSLVMSFQSRDLAINNNTL